MLSSFFRRLQISIRSHSETRGFRFFVPLNAITEPFEDFVDLMHLIALIMPKISVNIKAKEDVTLKVVADMIEVGERIITELGHCGSFDLLDIKSEDTSVKIGIR